MLYNNSTICHDRHNFKVNLEYDDSAILPWVEYDGHGPVSDWTRRSKESGEMVLCSDRGMHRYYDYAKAVKIAKRDGWDSAPYSDTETRGQKAAKAALADYNYLRRFLNDQWHYCGVIVELLDDSGDAMGESESLWAIESDDYDHIETTAHELASEILDRLQHALSA